MKCPICKLEIQAGRLIHVPTQTHWVCYKKEEARRERGTVAAYVIADALSKDIEGMQPDNRVGSIGSVVITKGDAS